MSSCSPGKAVLDISCGSLSASLCVKDLYNGSSRCVLLGSVVLTPWNSSVALEEGIPRIGRNLFAIVGDH